MMCVIGTACNEGTLWREDTRSVIYVFSQEYLIDTLQRFQISFSRLCAAVGSASLLESFAYSASGSVSFKNDVLAQGLSN